MGDVRLPARVAAAFGVAQEVTALPGTERRTYRGGDVILRHGAGGAELLWTMEGRCLRPEGFPH